MVSVAVFVDSIFTWGACITAVFGAVVGVFVDRLWKRLEARPYFRVQVGLFGSVDGRGHSLSITNVGLASQPEYQVGLFHPDRGTLYAFQACETAPAVFPQLPGQMNKFRCTTQPKHQHAKATNGMTELFFKQRDEQVPVPVFKGFVLKLVMVNSDIVLFQDSGLGNHLAKKIYEDASGTKTSQDVKPVYYRSQAPFCVEWLRRRRANRLIRRFEREKGPQSST